MISSVTYRLHDRVPMIEDMFRRMTGLVTQLAGIVLLSTSAFGQYGPGGTVGSAPGSTPSYGHAKTIGIGVGAAAAGVGAVYLLTHRASKVTGCTQLAGDGLHLTDGKTKRTLALLPGAAAINAGERVELKGKIKKNPDGDQSFLVKTVAKDFGSCHTQASAGAPVAAELPLR